MFWFLYTIGVKELLPDKASSEVWLISGGVKIKLCGAWPGWSSGHWGWKPKEEIHLGGQRIRKYEELIFISFQNILIRSKASKEKINVSDVSILIQVD